MVQQRSKKKHGVELEYSYFLSYAHADDKTYRGIRWVSSLHRHLGIRLWQYLGWRFDGWWDPKIRGNEELRQQILQALEKTVALIPVVSPAYLRSRWCRWELQQFRRICREQGLLNAGGKLRILKVMKTHVPLREQPLELQELLSYEFYEIQEKGPPIEYGPDHPTDKVDDYWRIVDDLAWDLKELINALLSVQPEWLEQVLPEISTPSGDNGGSDARQLRLGKVAGEDSNGRTTLYLAETASELRPYREQLRRSLLLRDYRLLPDSPLLADPVPETKIREALQQSRLSIHLLSPSDVDFFLQNPDSLIRLQLELASDRTSDRDFSQLLWLSPEFEQGDVRLRELLEIVRLGGVQDSVEILHGTLQELETLIEDKLQGSKRLESPAVPTEVRANGAGSWVYLVCDRTDREGARRLRDRLLEQGCEVAMPLFEGDPSIIRQVHQRRLEQCEGVLIYYGEASEAWLGQKRSELRRLAGLRPKPPLVQAVYLGPPPKERPRVREDVIDGTPGFSPDLLESLLMQLGIDGGTNR